VYSSLDKVGKLGVKVKYKICDDGEILHLPGTVYVKTGSFVPIHVILLYSWVMNSNLMFFQNRSGLIIGVNLQSLHTLLPAVQEVAQL
jgi:hypothetical protein